MKQNFMDRFKPRQETDDAALNEVNAALLALGDRARKCLSNDDFKLYRKDYTTTEAKLVDALIAFNKAALKNPTFDVTKYAMTISSYLIRLDDLRSLLAVVVKDAQKGVVNEKP